MPDRSTIGDSAGAAVAAAEREHQADIHRRLVEIVKLLHGLPVGEAEHLLNESKRLMKTIILVDATGPGFAELVRSYRDTFGDGTAPPSKPN